MPTWTEVVWNDMREARAREVERAQKTTGRARTGA